MDSRVWNYMKFIREKHLEIALAMPRERTFPFEKQERICTHGSAVKSPVGNSDDKSSVISWSGVSDKYEREKKKEFRIYLF